MKYQRHRSKRYLVYTIQVASNDIHATKMVDGSVGTKCSFTVRGFNAKFPDSDINAGATYRSGRRPVNAVAAENPDFVLFSFDVSKAFVKGVIFE